MKNEVQLITYADRLSGGTLQDLRALLNGPLAGVFGAVHILPFFYSIHGADAGFDPIDHTRVDPALGDWSDIKALAQDMDVMADVIVNHMSSDSPQFIDYSKRGAASPYNGLFLTFDAVFPEGATEEDLISVYRPRPGLPFTCMTLANGEKKILWTTFTPKQLDIDVQHPQGRSYLESILQALASSGVKMIRLDAVGYAIKKQGDSCFLMPETFDFIDEFAALCRSVGLEVLVEVHSYYRKQIEIAKRVDWVYDFALPPLVLHAFFFKTGKHLKQWIAQRPTNALTVLDTHDGIGIIDIGADPSDRVNRPGLVPPQELDRLVEIIHINSGGQSREATGAAASNLDLYQVNCTFYDAMGRDDTAYLLARAIQFFMPGIPQVYYVGLLAGRNDMDLLERTRVGRDINRHRYASAEVDSALGRPVVQQLLELIRLRNAHPAFDGAFSVEPTGDSCLHMRWINGPVVAELLVDFTDLRHELLFTDEGGTRRIAFAKAF
ncbi:sucrose phosphorylase [Polaromonas naphthalenivorans]|uniref:Alpha amylase, catalytic region n=1 Tax=Polaromonas naphthalenivorans (strain CJ2) TaxID=365044 RepID=A1VIS9_POLNA|nr:sucrose phosphorylase [Polaromonas naphthalenivorans]ABM35557.1 alpha amylase, catalytic region [Polaromonas naphthalenivorans CJ2]